MSRFSISACSLRNLVAFMLFSVTLLLGTSLWGEELPPLTLTVSPASLSFGIPTGTSPAVSNAQVVTVNIAGSGSVSFPTAPSTGTSAFSVIGTSCQGTLTAPTTCQVSVTFASTSASLLTDTLTIPYGNSNSSLTVPLSGAYGAIKLFSSTTVQTSQSSASFTNLYTIASSSLNLSCPSNPTAVLSNTPDGNGYVLTDNYIVLAINGQTVTTSLSANGYSAEYSPGVPAYPLGNVCQGSDASPDSNGGNTYPECFTAAYRSAVNNLLGADGDSITNPGNSNPFLNGSPAGVPPLNIQTFFGTAEGNTAPPFPLTASVTLYDAGGEVASSSVFLITNCSVAGVVPGGSITGNPVSTTNTSSQTQTFTFDNNPNQNISITTSDSVAIQQGTGTINNNVTPIAADFGLTQSTFASLVTGSSAAPSVCLRLTGEIGSAPDAGGQFYQCKGYQVECYDPSSTTTSGNNCGTSTVRNLFDAVKFDSPDTPLPATIANSFSTSCAYYLSYTLPSPYNASGTCVASSAPSQNPATLIGPGLLMFGDSPEGPACPLAPPFSSSGPCPLNTLTSLLGAADYDPGGSTVPTRNTIYVPVVNMALPFTTVTSPSINSYGWSNSNSPTINFSSNHATYSPAPTNPPPNGWQPAPPYSLTYGLAPASQTIPDTTYPVAGDTSNFNPASGVNPNYSAQPICPSGLATTAFPTAASFSSLADGLYNVHYFTTACDYSEELYFLPNNAQLVNPTANWASFPVLPFGVDTTPPALSCSQSPSSAVYNGWYNQNVTFTCNASDTGSGLQASFGAPTTITTDNPGYSSFVSTVQQGPSTGSYAVSTSVASGSTNSAATIPAQQVSDLAGNSSPIVPGGTFQIDRQAPSITATFNPAAGTYVAGQTASVTISWTCSDTGSGVASCAPSSASLPPGVTYSCSGLGSQTVNCSATFVPAAVPAGNYQFSVASTDNVGNGPTNYGPVAYSVSYSPATVGIAGIPTVAVPGTNLVLLVVAGDTNPATNPVAVYGANVNVQLQIPSNVLATGTASAIYADVTCTSFPCTVTPSGGAACSVSPSSVSSSTTTVSVNCNVGTIADLSKNKTGVAVKITLPISAKAPTKNTNIKATGTVTATTPISVTNVDLNPLTISVL